MNIDTAKLWHAALFTLRHIASAALIFGIIGYLAAPHAQQFIKETVNDRLNLLEMQMNDVRQSVRDQQREQAIMSNDIGNMKEIQRDTKSDTRMILQSIQGMRRELRE